MCLKSAIIVLLAAGYSAARFPNETVSYSWTVHNFNGTCSAAACWAWGFSITGSTGPSNQTAFVASDCTVDSRIEDHQPCKSLQMDVYGAAKVQIEGANLYGGLLSVQYTFQHGPIRYTYYGNHTVERLGDSIQPGWLQPAEFDIVPHAASAVGLL